MNSFTIPSYLFYALSGIAIVITLTIGLQKNLLGLAFFAITPYVGLLYILKIAKATTASITAKTVTLFLVAVGLYFLLDTTYMQRYLQMKFSFLFIPIWQWTMLLVSGLVVYLSNEKKSLRSREWK